jgi:AcrR family transcriptional regulator
MMGAEPLRQSREPVGDARQIRSRGALNGALLALLEEQPFEQLTIRAITARAGTGYATFFRHYADKEALLADVASEEIADLLRRTIPLLHDINSLESTRALCASVAAHRKLWVALLTGGAAGIVREEFIRQARALDQSVARPKFWLPSDLGVVFGTGATIDLLAWWLAQDEDYASDRIAAILHRLVIAPLVGDIAPAGEQD